MRMQWQDCWLVVSFKMELSTSTPFSQPSDQNAVVINKVYDNSLEVCQVVWWLSVSWVPVLFLQTRQWNYLSGFGWVKCVLGWVKCVLGWVKCVLGWVKCVLGWVKCVLGWVKIWGAKSSLNLIFVLSVIFSLKMGITHSHLSVHGLFNISGHMSNAFNNMLIHNLPGCF